MKVLLHDGFGLWLCTRRLHQGSLYWPSGEQPQISLNAQQWQALTVGLPWCKLGPDMNFRCFFAGISLSVPCLPQTDNPKYELTHWVTIRIPVTRYK